MAGRTQDVEARRARRQKIFVAVGGVVLLGIVGFEVLPGVLSSSSSGSSGDAVTSAPASAPLTAAPAATRTVAVAVAVPTGPKLPHSVERAAPRDLFMPLVVAGAVKAAPALHTPTAPAVRAKHFVVKDPFIPQVKAPSTP